jgi:hypothetical protein
MTDSVISFKQKYQVTLLSNFASVNSRDDNDVSVFGQTFLQGEDKSLIRSNSDFNKKQEDHDHPETIVEVESRLSETSEMKLLTEF